MSKKFPSESPEIRKLIEKDHQEKSVERLEKYLEKISENLNKEGVPVTRECRINLDAFDKVYPREEIEKDKIEIREYERKWYKGLSESEIRKQKLEQAGEKLEMLKTAIFNKNLSEDFIVARTSSHDDIKNGIDNIVLERETGNLVCALDEVSEISGPIFEEKKKKVLDKNRRGDGKLKYGIKLEKGRISLGKIENLPIFYLALPQRYLEKGIEEFIPSFEKKSEYETNIFYWFISSIDSQIKTLKLEARLNKDLKQRMLRFEKVIQQFRA